MAAAVAPLVIIIFGVAFGCSIKVRLASGGGTVIIRLRRMMIVAFEIIIDVVFGIEIAVIGVVNGEGPTINPAVQIIIVSVIDEAKGPIIMEGRVMVVVVKIIIVKIIIDVVFGFEIIVVIVVVNGKGPPFLGLILHPSVRIIIVCVDEAKGPIISGVRGLHMAVTVIVKQ